MKLKVHFKKYTKTPPIVESLFTGKKKASEKYRRPTVYRKPRDDELNDDDEFKVIYGLKPNPKGTKYYY